MQSKRGPRALHKKTIPNLQATLWPIFALYIKKNHAVDGVHCKCFTCDKPLVIGSNDCQAGHFMPRTKSPTKYDEFNVYPQCMKCNYDGEGETVEFQRRLIDQIGKDAVDELIEKSKQPWKWDRTYLIEKIEYYKESLKMLG